MNVIFTEEIKLETKNISKHWLTNVKNLNDFDTFLILKFSKIDFCVYIKVSLWKGSCYRSSILKSLQKLLVQVG